MRILPVLLLAGLSCAFAGTDPEALRQSSLLYRSGKYSDLYAAQIAKALPPPREPQTQKCLSKASVWCAIDLSALGDAPLNAASRPELWDALRNLGVEAVDLRLPRKGVRGSGAEKNWAKIVDLSLGRGMLLIGSPLSAIQETGPDFQLALQGFRDYAHLFHLIEIKPSDWHLLPATAPNTPSASIPIATVQKLKQLGYLAGRPEEIYPNSGTSCFAASAPVKGADGVLRRFVFLTLPAANLPALNWLDPTFTSQKLAGGEIALSRFLLQQSILAFDVVPLRCRDYGQASLPGYALEPLVLLTRQLGGFSVLNAVAPLEAYRQLPADLFIDTITPQAVLHALLTEDAEALGLIYRALLDAGLQPASFVHCLQSYDNNACDWNAILGEGKKVYRYKEEEVTADVLAERLRQEDLDHLRNPSPIPIAQLFGLCPDAPSLEEHKEEFLHTHLLLAFFYAMQPGAFSLSGRDIRGALGDNPLQGSGLYPPLPKQLKDPNSFASRLKPLLSLRKQTSLPLAELAAVLPSSHKGTILLLHRLHGGELYLLAVNFSSAEVEESLADDALVNCSAINLATRQTEEKLFGSDTFTLRLAPKSGKALLFRGLY